MVRANARHEARQRLGRATEDNKKREARTTHVVLVADHPGNRDDHDDDFIAAEFF